MSPVAVGLRRSTAALVACIVVTLPLKPATAETPACNQARAIVEEVRAQATAGSIDHQAALRKLATARDLCFSLGEAWLLSYCSAAAVGDKKTGVYRDRALFTGVTELNCPGQASVPAPLPSRVRQKFALVVGISEFQDAGITPLRFAAKDAEDLAAVLTDPRHGRFAPENVQLLTNEQATRSNILNALQELILQTQEDDLVFMYVSSHGSPRKQQVGLAGIGYIITHDTSIENLWVEAIEYEDFARKASLIKARRKAIFLDTCYSGQVRIGERALVLEPAGLNVDTAKLFVSGEGTYVVTSSKDVEKSYESENLQNGFFTYFLIEALRATETPPTLREVFDHLSGRVSQAVAKEKRAPQNPQMIPRNALADLRIGVAPSGTEPPKNEQ